MEIIGHSSKALTDENWLYLLTKLCAYLDDYRHFKKEWHKHFLHVKKYCDFFKVLERDKWPYQGHRDRYAYLVWYSQNKRVPKGRAGTKQKATKALKKIERVEENN
jgi:hypothetical protein